MLPGRNVFEESIAKVSEELEKTHPRSSHVSRHVAALLLNAFERGGGNAVATSQIATAIIEKLRALAPGCDRRSQQAREVASFEARVVTAATAAAARASSMLTESTVNPCAPNSSFILLRCGISCLQGPHQVAQKFNNTTRPL